MRARWLRFGVMLVASLGVVGLALALGMTRGDAPGATAQTATTTPTTATATTPTTALPANPPTCTARTLGVSRTANPGLAADCDTLLAIKSTLRVTGWLDYDRADWLDHGARLNWSAAAPMRFWKVVTLGGTPQRVTGLDFSDTRESVKVYHARLRRFVDSEHYTRQWTLRGVIPTQLGNLTALETLDLGGSELTGVIPTQLGSLTKLTRLDLSDNRLRGNIPTQLGGLTALTRLDLSANLLSGALPVELDDLDSPLGRLGLAGNAFTGCVPANLWRAISHDLDALGLPTCKPPLRYGPPQTTGIVDAPGEYAFFSTRGPVLTYEGLRNDVAQVVIHQHDADGDSHAAIYDDVEAGDDFEWREADDCWVRYLVEQVFPDPTDIPLKVLAVRRYGYTYTGCSGAVSTTGDRTLTWVPHAIKSPDITVPVRHGPWLMVPLNWDGAIEAEVQVTLPPLEQSGPSGEQGNEEGAILHLPLTHDPVEAAAVRRYPLWREPNVPLGWQIVHADAGGGWNGYSVWYSDSNGYYATVIHVSQLEWQPFRMTAIRFDDLEVSDHPTMYEMRTIDGKASVLRYSPAGNVLYNSKIMSYDHLTGFEYIVVGVNSVLKANVSKMIKIAQSLYEENN